MTPGHCLLSHGLNSRPDATKVSALARTAAQLGWSCERLDYRDLDENGQPEDVERRIQRLVDATRNVRGPLVLAGSSLGAYIAGRISLEVPVRGLFLMAPPITMGPLPQLDAAAVPVSIIHGWDDELIPAQAVTDWAHARRARLLLVDDGHRLSDHVVASAEAFGQLLAAL